MRDAGQRMDIRRPTIHEGVGYIFVDSESFYYFLSLLGNQLGEKIPDIKFKKGMVAKLTGKVLLLTEDDGQVHHIFSSAPLASIATRLERNRVRYIGFREITLSSITNETFQRMGPSDKRGYFWGYLVKTSDTLGDFDFMFYGSSDATRNKASETIETNPLEMKVLHLEHQIRDLEGKMERMARYLYSL